MSTSCGRLCPAADVNDGHVCALALTASSHLDADEQGAQNPIAYDDDVAARLYDETGRILSAKISAFDGGRQWAGMS
jgi:hypothetical protein